MESEAFGAGPRGRFETTRWSLVIAAGARDERAAEEALAQLCATYWYPVFAFVRRQGHRTEEAEDLTQAFFSRVIEKGWIGEADQSRGRFRTFLLTACQRFLYDERDRGRALKRGGAAKMVPIDTGSAERRYARSLSHSETPEHLFEKQWCLTLLDSVLRDLRDSYRASGNERLFDRLASFLTMADDAGSYEDAARDLGISAGAARVAAHRLRRRYRDAFRARISDTVASDRDVEDELRHLLSVLRND